MGPTKAERVTDCHQVFHQRERGLYLFAEWWTRPESNRRPSRFLSALREVEPIRAPTRSSDRDQQVLTDGALHLLQGSHLRVGPDPLKLRVRLLCHAQKLR